MKTKDKIKPYYLSGPFCWIVLLPVGGDGELSLSLRQSAGRPSQLPWQPDSCRRQITISILSPVPVFVWVCNENDADAISEKCVGERRQRRRLYQPRLRHERGIVREGGGRDGGHFTSLVLLWRAAWRLGGVAQWRTLATGWITSSTGGVEEGGRRRGKSTFDAMVALSPSYRTGDLIIRAARRRKNIFCY